jgi:hypothetical protein
MAFLKKRTKLVSFRLSEEEYEKLSRASMAGGARSISDFARSALQRTVTGENGSDHSDHHLERTAQELIDTMKELSRHVGQLIVLAQSNKGTGD